MDVLLLVRKDTDVNEHKRLSNSLTQINVQEQHFFFQLFYISITEGFLPMSIIHTLQ
jgi:hypothetical protein